MGVVWRAGVGVVARYGSGRSGRFGGCRQEVRGCQVVEKGREEKGSVKLPAWATYYLMVVGSVGGRWGSSLDLVSPLPPQDCG